MKTTGRWAILFLCCFLAATYPQPVLGDSAEVLPKGVFRADAVSYFYLPIDERFDPDGNKEDVATDFNATLDSNVFPDLALLDNIFFGGTPGASVLGNSVVSFEYEAKELFLALQYGLTDKLTVGVILPYKWYKTKVKVARLDTGSATVGKNPFFGTPGDPFGGAPFIPIGLGGIPLDTEDVQDILGSGLSINGQPAVEGFGFKRLETWSDDGFGDIELGGRYQYYKSDNWRLAFTGGVRLPTGKVDDPDNLIDLGFGTGAYALLFRFNQDYTGFENLTLNATIRYDLVLPDKEVKRVRSNVNNPLAPLANKEKVDRDLGDVIQLEASGTYKLSKAWSASLLYQYYSPICDPLT